MEYLCTKHGELFKELLDTSDILQDIARKSVENQPVMEVSAKEALEMLLGRVDLSQRGYNNLRDILAKANVKLPRYQVVMDYEKSVEIGVVRIFLTVFLTTGSDLKCPILLVFCFHAVFETFCPPPQ